jgi:oligoendopeptidase F
MQVGLLWFDNDPHRGLTSKIEDTFATVFRQIAMNRFEDAIHNSRRSEGELPTDRLSEMWLTTQRAMFEDSVTITDDYGVWWSYIPHFIHTPGYVYAYSFGQLLVLSLYRQFKQEGDSFKPRYKQILSAGGSKAPQQVLADAGIDIHKAEFWQGGFNVINELVNQLENLTMK